MRCDPDRAPDPARWLVDVYGLMESLQEVPQLLDPIDPLAAESACDRYGEGEQFDPVADASVAGSESSQGNPPRLAALAGTGFRYAGSGDAAREVG